MNLRLTNLLIFVFLTVNSYSQEKHTTITGKIFSLSDSVDNVHIINLNNLTGTLSNDYGEFEIKVHLNDTILFSSIQYEKIKIVVTKKHLNSKIMEISLIPSINNLDEVFLHGLTGNLNLDLDKKPKDTTPKHNFAFKLSDLDKKLPGDEFGYQKDVNAESFTNPVYLAGGGQGSKYNKQLENERALKRKLAKMKEFPYQLRKRLGDDFFINSLKIPKEKIYLFIDYCESKDISAKYVDNRLLEIIEILKEESNSYNKIKD